MPQWEYYTFKVDTKGFNGGKVDQKNLDIRLNQAGREGWELVTAVSSNQAFGSTLCLLYTFKRQVA